MSYETKSSIKGVSPEIKYNDNHDERGRFTSAGGGGGGGGDGRARGGPSSIGADNALHRQAMESATNATRRYNDAFMVGRAVAASRKTEEAVSMSDKANKSKSAQDHHVAMSAHQDASYMHASMASQARDSMARAEHVAASKAHSQMADYHAKTKVKIRGF